MIKRIASRDFYQSQDLVIQRVMENIEEVSCPVIPGSVEYGPPLVMATEPARDWLLGNYLFATSFCPGKPPAMGEVVAAIPSREAGSLIIPELCFDEIQSVFSSLREAESKFGGDGLYRTMMEGRSAPEIVELARKVLKHYSNEAFPLIARNGIWEIDQPPLELSDEDWIDGRVHVRGVHTHVGNFDWTGAIISGTDFKSMSEGNCSDGRFERSEEYVMHFPISVLYGLQKSLKNNGKAATANGKAVKASEVAKYLDEVLEYDLLGLKFVWSPGERALEVSPIVSEAHINGAKGKIPEGRDMGVKSLYVNINPDYPSDRPVLVGVKKLMEYRI